MQTADKRRPFTHRRCASQELGGRVWEGKESLLRAAGALGSSCGAALRAPGPMMPDALVAALLEAAGKKRASYRKEALEQLTKGESAAVARLAGRRACFLELGTPRHVHWAGATLPGRGALPHSPQLGTPEAAHTRAAPR